MMCRLLRGLGVPLVVAITLNPLSARADTVETLVMPGKVVEGHADIEGQCRKCHQPFKKEAQNALCLDCHKDVAQDISSKAGHHGRLTENSCRECHAEHLGRSAKIVKLDESRFDHRLTDFLLLGKHAGVKCASCHAPEKKFREAAHDCESCHRKDDVHRGSLGPDCQRCHSESDWKKAKFDHDKTQFPLRGRHVQPKCRACHRTQNFKQTPKECAGCHRTDDVHKGKLGANCAQCHNDRDWKNTAFDHGKTRFPLAGAHVKTRCLACHKSQSFNDAPSGKCVGCHVKNDVHKARYGEKCETCHGEASWKTLKFEHERDAGFKLREAHSRIKCDACHSGRLYLDKAPKDCNGCHATKDVHKGSLGTTCATCHGESSWKKTTFDHDRNTKYPLRGRHAAVACKTCHVDGTFRQKLATQCIACHKKDDRHAGQEGTDCERCHTEASWKTTNFDHGRSGFPLSGRHFSVKCDACHASARFKDARKECAACHTKHDAHKGRLGSDCAACHNARDWRIWDFDHDKTRFGLDGAHRKLACTACHTRPGNRIPAMGTLCIDCHERDDIHRESFGTRCERCHLTTTFKEIRR
jgi:hypothetical protein